MKIFELLLEYDISKVNSLAGKLQSRAKDPSAPPAQSPVDLAQAIEQLGVRSGEILFWILYRYLTPFENGYGINRWEDIASRVLPALEKFTKLKNKKKIPPEKRDLNRFKSLSQLDDLLDQYPDEELASQKQQSATEEQSFYDSKQATLVYNDAAVKVVVPHTQEASQYFGKNTRWCTSSQKNNMFSEYNKDGPLYIVLIKPLNKRWQFHWPSNQFMNDRDEQINPNLLAEEYPILWRIFGPIAEKNKSLILNPNPTEEQQLAAVNNLSDDIQYIKKPSEAVQLAAVNKSADAIRFIKNPSEEIQLAAVKQGGYAIQYIKNPSEAVQLAAASGRGDAIRFIKNPSEEIQLAAVKNDGKEIEYIENPSEAVQLAAVKQNGYAIYFIKNPSEAVQLTAVKDHPDAIQFIENPSDKVKKFAATLGNR